MLLRSKRCTVKKKVVNIAENGSTSYTILIASNSSEAQVYAARELRSYLKTITGVTFSIKTETQVTASTDGYFLSVGNTELFKNCNFNVDYTGLNGDGFVVKSKGNSLFFNGASDRGTIYSVYDWLEKECGVKFLASHYEYVPTMAVIPFVDTDILEIPSFTYRGALADATYHYDNPSTTTTDDCEIIGAKQRITHEFLDVAEKYGGTIKINDNVNTTHNNLSYVMYQTNYANMSAEQKTAFYNEVMAEGSTSIYKNIRLTDEWQPTASADSITSKGYFTDICYTHGILSDGSLNYVKDGNTASLYLDGLKHYISLNPDEDFYICGQEDIRNMCRCAYCTNSNATHTSTGTVIRFYNAIARAIQEWADTELNGKEIKIMIFAYYYSSEAPVKSVNGSYQPINSSVVVADNIIVRFADITANVIYSFVDDNNTVNGYGPEYLKKWAPVLNGNQVWYWGYTTNHSHYFAYQGSLNKLSTTLNALKDANCSYAILQANTTEYHDFKSNMEMYVQSKMLWDCSLDANELRNEYITYFYGAVAEEVREIVADFDAITTKAMNKDPLRAWWDMDNKSYYSISDFNAIYLKINAAIDKVRSLYNNGKLDKAECDRLVAELQTIKLYPTYSIMIIEKRDAGNNYELTDFARLFFSLCDELGVKQYGEGKTIASLKTTYGYTA